MKFIQFIDRVLWGTRIASLTSPTYVGGHMPHAEETPSVTERSGAAPPRTQRTWEDAYLVNA